MLTYFHRCLPLYYVLLCSLLGLSLAWLVTSVAQVQLSAETPPVVQRPAPGRGRATTTSTSSDPRIILQRNIFNSKQAALTEIPVAASTRPGAIPARISTQASRLTLIGTVVAPMRSMAVLKNGTQIAVYHLNERLPDNSTLIDIQRNRVELRNSDGSRSLLELEENGQTATTAAPGNGPLPSAGSAIKTLGDNRWAISSQEAQRIRNDIASIIKQVRVDPHVVNGQTQGFVVKQIQRGTLLEQMGIQRGDILRAVNGVTLDSPEKGLQVFQQLREAKNLDVSLQRAGNSLNFQYEIK